MKQQTLTFYYEHCGECPNVLDYFDHNKKDFRCELSKRGRGNRIIPTLWGEIPGWCPLENKGEE
uniref:Uncharacterized protein n=1 Tax=viral metagenome TaxID=1070528 RepID=A0A6H1ZEL4_9ZZZZ